MRDAKQSRPRHYFTVDVEEFFQVVALAPYAPMSRWNDFESRVEHSVDELLELMARFSYVGTFFTVGWVAERHPAMMRRIADAGHEVASHTYDHVRITHQTPEAFRASVRRTKQIIEDITGQRVSGFRAPSFSIVPGTEWAFDILLEEGHSYDSSLFPVRRRGYGYPGGKRDPYLIPRPSGALEEYPPATLSVLGATLPAAGGAYLRLLPLGLVRAALRSAENRGQAATVYTHPWEWDPGQPRLAVPPLTRVRHYGGLAGVLGRITELFEEFQFTSIRDGVKPS